MDFEQWRATRRYVPDARKLEFENPYTVDPAYPDNPSYPQPAFVYAGFYVIGIVTDDWPDEVRRTGAFHCLMGNHEPVSDDLADIERQLWDNYGRELEDLEDEPPLQFTAGELAVIRTLVDFHLQCDGDVHERKDDVPYDWDKLIDVAVRLGMTPEAAAKWRGTFDKE